MKSKREMLLKLQHYSQRLLSETEPFAQAAQPERALDRESRRYMRVVNKNVLRIERMLNDAQSLWAFGDHQLT